MHVASLKNQPRAGVHDISFANKHATRFEAVRGNIDTTMIAIKPLVANQGVELLRDPQRNKSTAFTEAERKELGLTGLLPAGIDTEEPVQWEFQSWVGAVAASTPKELSDTLLMTLLTEPIGQQSFNSLFEEVFRRYHERVKRALDLTQECFLKHFAASTRSVATLIYRRGSTL
jgi:hypothetical protein